MIVILNGPLGIGKTEVSWALLERFERAAMLDGDYIGGAVRPFDIFNPADISYVFRAVHHLAAFHQANGYAGLVVNYVFETPGQLEELRGRLRELDETVYAFRLTCAEPEHARRILARAAGSQAGPDETAWELERGRALASSLALAAERGDLGLEIDTTGRSAAETAAEIWNRLPSS